MQKFLRALLIVTLCSLSLVSSNGASEALHANLHALTSSACTDTARSEKGLVRDQNILRQQMPGVSAATGACPLELILHATLAQAVTLPNLPAIETGLRFDPSLAESPLLSAFVSPNTGWSFSRGPPSTV